MAEGLLPGERMLWTGQPSRVRVRLADVGVSLYELAALAVVAVISSGQWHSLPVLLRAFMVIIVAGAVIQVAVMLAYRVMIRPRQSRQTVYQITDWRVVVTTGLRTRRSWSAYLDQISEPALRRHRDGSQDLVLRASSGPVMRRMLAGTLGSGPFSSLGQSSVPDLRSVADALQAQQIAVAARQRMLNGLAVPVPAPAGLVTAPLPAGVALEPGERVLWTGRPMQVPWWFGAQDMYLSAFGLVWLICVGLMGALAVTGGSGAFLVVLVPFAAAGGLYPAAGRLIHRRMRIRRSMYLITDRRLIASWQLGGQPVTVLAPLGQLLPPAARWQALFTDLADLSKQGRSAGWKSLLWPAATTTPPALIGIADPQAAYELIAAAQLALRTAASVTERAPGPATPDPQ